MQYYVLASDGQEYGPADINQLKSWIAENRLSPASRLRDATSGVVVVASTIPGLFPPSAPPQQTYAQAPTYSAAPNFNAMPGYGAGYGGNSDSISPLISTLVRSGLGLVFFFLLQGIGLIITGFAFYYAIRIKANGNRYGTACLLVSGISLAVIGIGWLFRLAQ